MGTRSLINIYDYDDEILTTVYRQFDGYLARRGRELVEFAKRGTVVNGIPVGESNKRYFNGPGDFAAQWIAYEKESVGNVYINTPGSTDCGEEYAYNVYFEAVNENGAPANPYDFDITRKIRIEAWSVYDTNCLFDGYVEDIDIDKAIARENEELSA